MDKENLVWSTILTTVLKMPGVKVDRIAFLRKELRPYCNQSRLQMIGSVRPYTVVSEQVIDKLAKQYGSVGTDFTKFPTFTFKEPELEPVGLQLDPKKFESQAEGEEAVAEEEEDKPWFEY